MSLKKVIGIALPLFIAFAQNSKAQEVKIGDKYPEFTFNNIVNYTKPFLKLSDFKGKAIILDFWNTYCTSCLKEFPKLDSLQQIFKDEVQIILVNSESRDKTETFFAKHKNIHKPNLPMITGDAILKAAFPSVGQPYIVWISKDGIIKYFSNGANLSSYNIGFFIEGKKLVFRDPTLEKFGPAVEENNFEYLSFISRCYETLNIGNGEIHEINNGRSVSIKNNCSSVIDLLKKAFSEFGKYDFETSYGLKLDITDSFKYLQPKNIELLDHWLSEYAYNYQLILPKERYSEAYKVMQNDLIKYFGVKVTVETLCKPGLIIYKDSSVYSVKKWTDIDKFKSLSAYALANPDSVIVFTNEPYKKISEWLRVRIHYYLPFEDRVNYSGNTSLVIRKSSLRPFNLNQLREDLAPVGVSCDIREMEVDMLYIKSELLKKANK